ncbi:hypothetical protein G7Y89_g13580 [Cudoniella acicularis]|uniref:NmrA-like domain-containing protein n=1 Tax=Cudoniella acicularis TaxID=354080 RepID=A0A8H4R6L9_9HELO|nr:hypothetical protein G7Y89_g13580 [Cudoniella acicularis]
MAAFRNVALLGATGNLGTEILAALNTAGFNVTAIQRKDSKNVATGAAKSIKVDLANASELAEAFKGQDVVVSTVPTPKLVAEKAWIDAAVSAQVKRIVPSEFSTNMEVETSQTLPILKDKLEIRKYVEGLASSGKIEWTSINNGPFLVNFLWLSGWMGPNPKTKTTTLHDGGEKIVCSSTLERIGESVAKVLLPEHAESTKNKSIYVYSAAISEKQMSGIVSKVLGTELKETNVSISSVVKETNDALAKGNTSKIMNFYIPFCFSEEYRGDFRYQAWNQKLGLKEMTNQEVEDLVKGWLSG